MTRKVLIKSTQSKAKLFSLCKEFPCVLDFEMQVEPRNKYAPYVKVTNEHGDTLNIMATHVAQAFVNTEAEYL